MPSRRALLRSGAALAGTASVPTRGPSFVLPQALGVYTQNLGLGTRLSRLIDRRSRTVDPENVYRRYVDVRDSGVPERMAAVADCTETANFALNAQLTLRDGRRIVATRGYALVEAQLGGSPLTFCSTHLSSASSDIREAQAAELADQVRALGGPVVVAGDLNSAPTDGDQSAYAPLTDPLRDVWRGEGPTCCQLSNLTNGQSRLDHRIDAVLVRGAVQARGSKRAFTDPESRVETTVDVGTVRRWPSDHAGVFAGLVVTGETDLFSAPTGILGGERPASELLDQFVGDAGVARRRERVEFLAGRLVHVKFVEEVPEVRERDTLAP
jgi:endonuclease/exonuclease/phosphatase family metal-dependent hydrolase